MKWSFIPQDNPKPKYLVVNADESEPGTCKDIPLMMGNPHVLVEGVIISSYAIRANKAFIYIRGEVLHVIRRVQAAVDEAYAAGHLGKDIHGSGYDLDVVVHAGAGAYICGEETALLEGLEGRRGQPRLRPPFPAVAGLYASPTVINNVESIASVPSIVANGAKWFASMGTEKSAGFGIFSLSGHVQKPGQYEAPLGITLRELLDLAGGVREGHDLKFWTPGGSSTPLLTAEHLDVPLDFEAIGAAGSMLGTRALQIFDDSVCVVRAVLRWTEFYKHESCGKCTPCREGTWWLVQTLGRLEKGQGSEADLDLLLDQCDNILGRSFCALGDGATSPISSSIQYFRDEYLAHLTHGGCPFDPARSTAWAGPGGVGMTTTPEKAVAKDDLVNVTIDGIQVAVPKDTLVIRAAEQVGVQIPRFCDHPLLAPVGACRQCLVDVPDAGNGRGFPKPQASCTLPVAEGMVVNSQVTSPVADKAQQGVMEFLLINHPLDCPVCDKGGECPLQNQAMSNGRGDSRFSGRAPPGASSAPSPSRSTCRPSCCSTVSAASSASAAPGSPRRSPATRSSRCSSVAPSSRSASPRTRRSCRTSPATSSRSARSVPSPPRPTASGPARSTWSRARPSPSTTPAAPRSGSTTDAARSCAARPATIPRSTRSGSPTRTGSPSPTPTATTGSPTLRSAAPTAPCVPRRGPRRSPWPPAVSLPPRRPAGSAC